jgi:hypothetical protein
MELARSTPNRVIGTLLLNRDTISRIDADQTAMPQAIGVVLVAGIANGIGVALTEPVGYLDLVTATLGNLVAWILFATIAYAVGVGIMHGDSTEAQTEMSGVLRTIGFAQAPNVLGVAVVIGSLGQLISFLGLMWVLVCGIAALGVSLRVSTGRAIAIGLIAGIVTLLVVGILLSVFEAVIT